MKRLLEICIDSIESGIIAERAGADRIEFCSNLYEGGTTPSFGAIRRARKKIGIALNVIIRPRGGDFLYSGMEYRIMKEDIIVAKEEGADGVVVGMLTPDGNIDIDRTSELVELASPLPVTFHRAFDMSPEPLIALEDIIRCGAARILTSGHSDKVYNNLGLIRELVKVSGKRIIIMPGSGINENNIASVISETDAQEIHLTGSTVINSKMRFKKSDIYMGGLAEIPEFTRKIADESRINKIREIIDSFE